MKTSKLFLFTLSLLAIFSSCQMENTEIEISGTWVSPENSWPEQWTITENNLAYSSQDWQTSEMALVYTADIILHSNFYDYAVIRFTNDCSYGYGKLNQYSIFKWRNNAANEMAMDFTQAYKDSGLDEDGDGWNDTVVYSSAREAAENATDETVFGYYSEGATRE